MPLAAWMLGLTLVLTVASFVYVALLRRLP